MKRIRGTVAVAVCAPAVGTRLFVFAPAVCFRSALQCIVNSTHLHFPQETRLTKGRADFIRLLLSRGRLIAFGLFYSVTRER